MNLAPPNTVQLLLACAQACQHAYHPDAQRVGNGQFSLEMRVIPGRGLCLVVAIAGTNDATDLLQDAQLLNRLDLGSRGAIVHSGFFAHWSTLRAEVVHQVQASRRSFDGPIIVTGHSLGAAAAAIGVYRDNASLFGRTPGDAFVPLGIPGVGNATWARELTRSWPGTTYRVVNNNDVVARSPRSLIPGRWAHVGQLVYLDRQGRAHLGKPANYVRDRILGRLNDLGRLGPDGLGDHRIASYVAALSRAAGQPVPPFP